MKQFIVPFLIIFYLFSSKNVLHSQIANDSSSELSTWIDAQFAAGLDSFNIAGATIVLVEGDSVLHLSGYGLADIESNTPVNANSSIFGVASISKTFVATAIMQLVEDGKVALDTDVNNYLTSFQLKYPFNDSITIQHLLTHTAGFDDRNIGTAVLSEKDLIPLAQYLKEQMPSQIRPSGQVITYSNHGYALLGLIVEEVSGIPFHAYVDKKIAEPLEMNNSGFKRQAKLKNNYVTSYLQKGGQLIPYQPDFQLYYPAGSFSSTASDMRNYISMFLNQGNYRGKQILDSESVHKMHYTGFKHYEKTKYGWSLGFPESNWNGVKLVGHGGATQGFISQLSLFPEKNIGLFISTNCSSYPNSRSRVFIDEFINDLLEQLMPESIGEKEKAEAAPQAGTVDEPLEKFTGNYRLTRYTRKTLGKMGVLIGLAPEITIISKDNTLEIPEWNDRLIPISDLTFHSKYDRYLAFGRNTKKEVFYFFAGAFAFHKLKWYEPVKFQQFWVGSIILILLTYIIVSGVRQLFIRNKRRHPIKTVNFSLASLIILFLTVLTYALITTDPLQFFYGVPLLVKITLVLPFIFIPLMFAAFYLLIKAIRYKELKALGLIYQSLIVAAALIFIPWLMYYNLIGFNY